MQHGSYHARCAVVVLISGFGLHHDGTKNTTTEERFVNRRGRKRCASRKVSAQDYRRAELSRTLNRRTERCGESSDDKMALACQAVGR
jgi:hypothetical protein